MNSNVLIISPLLYAMFSSLSASEALQSDQLVIENATSSKTIKEIEKVSEKTSDMMLEEFKKQLDAASNDD